MKQPKLLTIPSNRHSMPVFAALCSIGQGRDDFRTNDEEIHNLCDVAEHNARSAIDSLQHEGWVTDSIPDRHSIYHEIKIHPSGYKAKNKKLGCRTIEEVLDVSKHTASVYMALIFAAKGRTVFKANREVIKKICGVSTENISRSLKVLEAAKWIYRKSGYRVVIFAVPGLTTKTGSRN